MIITRNPQAGDAGHWLCFPPHPCEMWKHPKLHILREVCNVSVTITNLGDDYLCWSRVPSVEERVCTSTPAGTTAIPESVARRAPVLPCRAQAITAASLGSYPC